MENIQNIRLIGMPQSRVLHLVGDVNKALVTMLIDSIIAINAEEVILGKIREEEAHQIINRINMHKLVPTDSGQIGITMKSEEVEPIELYVNSGGGSFQDGMSLINAIKTSNVPIVAYVSMASSMATIISLTCDRIVTYPDTMFMIHEVAWDDGYDKLINHRKRVERSTKTQQIVDKIILDNSEIPPEELQKHYDSGDDWYIMGDDIRDYGMTNEISELKDNRDTTFIHQ